MTPRRKKLLENITARRIAVRNATVFDLGEKGAAFAEALENFVRDLDARIDAIESGEAAL